MHFLNFQHLTHHFDHRVISEPLRKLIEDYDVDADTKLYSIYVTAQTSVQIPQRHHNGKLAVICMKEIKIYNYRIAAIPEGQMKRIDLTDLCFGK